MCETRTPGAGRSLGPPATERCLVKSAPFTSPLFGVWLVVLGLVTRFFWFGDVGLALPAMVRSWCVNSIALEVKRHRRLCRGFAAHADASRGATLASTLEPLTGSFSENRAPTSQSQQNATHGIALAERQLISLARV